MKAELMHHLDALRTAVDEARSVPMSASVMINRTEFLEMLGSLEAAIEATISQATEVVGDREAFVDTGRLEALEILRQAEQQREDLVSDTDVYRLAVERAAEVEQEALQAASELRAETDEYVESKLANFEHTLERTIDLVRRGRAQLSGGHVHGLGDDSDVAAIHLPDHLER